MRYHLTVGGKRVSAATAPVQQPPRLLTLMPGMAAPECGAPIDTEDDDTGLTRTCSEPAIYVSSKSPRCALHSPELAVGGVDMVRRANFAAAMHYISRLSLQALQVSEELLMDPQTPANTRAAVAKDILDRAGMARGVDVTLHSVDDADEAGNASERVRARLEALGTRASVLEFPTGGRTGDDDEVTDAEIVDED